MYKDEQKAILMTTNKKWLSLLPEYFLRRYNLHTSTVSCVLEIIELLNADDCPDSNYELVIIDEESAGVETATQTLKTLKSKHTYLNVLQLSVLKELFPPYNEHEMELDSQYDDDEYRQTEMDNYMDTRIALQTPITQALNLSEAYEVISESIPPVYMVDWVFCSVLRLDEKPVRHGVIASAQPQRLDLPYEFPVIGTPQLEEMLANIRPLHIPTLEADHPFRNQMKRFFDDGDYGAALILPMQYDGNRIGMLAMFTEESDALYRLPDLDLLQRFTDMACVSIITHFYREHTNLDMDRIEKEVADKQTWEDSL